MGGLKISHGKFFLSSQEEGKGPFVVVDVVVVVVRKPGVVDNDDDDDDEEEHAGVAPHVPRYESGTGYASGMGVPFARLHHAILVLG